MARNDDYYDDRSASRDVNKGAFDDARTGDRAGSGDNAEPGVGGSAATGGDVARATAQSDDEMVYAGGREADDSWLTSGLAWALLATGLVLFLFPEPATSMLGIGLIVAGLAVWVLGSE